MCTDIIDTLNKLKVLVMTMTHEHVITEFNYWTTKIDNFKA